MPRINSIFLIKVSIFFGLLLQSIHCQADVPRLMIADSLFNQRSYKEAMEIYEVNFQSGIYSTSMLLKMAFIAEGIGDSERATLYLSKYYDLSPNPQTISKIKTLTGQAELVGYEVSDGMRFVLFLVEYKEILVGGLTLFLIMSLIVLWSQGRKLKEGRFYGPSILLIALIFAINNFLIKYSVIVSDTVTVGRNADRGHGIQKTRGQTAQAAVAQTRVKLRVAQLIQINVHFPQGRFNVFL